MDVGDTQYPEDGLDPEASAWNTAAGPPDNGILPSTGSVGDSCGNALMESFFESTHRWQVLPSAP